MKPKEKGDIALSQAIGYYMTNGYEVCLPIGDKKDYDFIVEKDEKLYKVQVKYAGYYPAKKKCLAGLRITGGNQSYHYAKKYSDKSFDFLFIYSEKGERYNIPWKHVSARSELSVENEKYRKFII